MRRPAVLIAVAVLIAGLALLAPRWLTREREYVAVTPQPASVGIPTSVKIPRDGRACMNLVALDVHSEQARIRPATVGPRPEPLTLTVSGQGYRAEREIAADYRDREPVAVDLGAPPRSLVATACVHNRGRRAVYLAGVNDRSRSRSAVLVNGRPAPAGFVLEFYERRPVSILNRLPESMRRMSVLRPGVVGPATLWPLLALLVIGVPAAALWAFARAVRDDEPS